jgi:hypothetical protein
MLQIQARPPAKPARHSPEAQPMADGQGEAAWGAKGEVVVIYCEPLATQEMRCRRLSHWVNNMAVFTIFMMPLGVNSIKAEKKSENADHYSL